MCAHDCHWSNCFAAPVSVIEKGRPDDCDCASANSSDRKSCPTHRGVGCRLVGDVVTQIVQSDARYANVDLLYASLPTKRLRTAPLAQPTVNGMAQTRLTVRVSLEERDLAARREEFACHRSQYASSAAHGFGQVSRQRSVAQGSRLTRTAMPGGQCINRGAPPQLQRCRSSSSPSSHRTRAWLQRDRDR